MKDGNRCPLSVSIVVMGVSGVGKSTVGETLARRLDVPWADADAFHPAANIAKMTAGTPLGDADRTPWLEAVGQWLADHDCGVMSCSALTRRYRDQLRCHRPDLEFLHLTGSPTMIAARHAGRTGHFMPASLLASQFDTLERLGPDERGIAIDAGQSVDMIVDAAVRHLNLGR